MRGLCTLILLFMLLLQTPADAFIFKKKDYPQIFLNNAQNAEKRKDINSAFHSYEKAMFYYKKDRRIIEAYAKFCERQKFFDRAQELYQRLYTLTKDKQYLFKSNLCIIKNGKSSKAEVDKILNDKGLNPAQKNEFNKALIYHYVYKKDWVNVKKSCDKISKKEMGLDTITTCIQASEKAKDKKNTLGYYLRFYDFNQKNYEVINKILALAQDVNDLETQEKFVKVLSALNPSDNGIKYRLAGVYEKQKNWQKAAQVYEGLRASGDTSEHVKNSLAYVQSQLHPKALPKMQPSPKIVEYKPKPLSGFKLAEKNFYEVWKEKKYNEAQRYLTEMLKYQPNNKKLLKHRVDIDVSQENYAEAITYFEKIKTDSITDTKFLAFLYSKTDNVEKALEIIENALQQNPKNKELLTLALEYSMALKNWAKGIIYTNQLLAYEPQSEKLLKNVGDLYATIKDYPNAIKAYEQLVKSHPKLEYYMELANYYMANKDFSKAEAVLEPIYNVSLSNPIPENQKIIDAYLNSLLAQQKIMQAYCVIKTNHLETTEKGYMILGDIAMIDRDYECAKINYANALTFDPESAILQNKLAQSYRMLKCLCVSTKIFNNVLAKDPCNLEARLGLGSIETDKKNFEKSRRIFCSILKENPDYRPAKIAIADSYIANDDNFAALETLENMHQDDEVLLMQDQIRYKMGIRPVMFKAIPDVPEMNVPMEDFSYKSEINPNRAINGAVYEDRKELEYKKRRNEAITLVPTYSIFTQQLADQFRLNYIRGGINLSKNIDGNKLVFMGYSVMVYSSGSPQFLNNFVNEFRGGIQARPKDKWEYRADIGVKAFQFGDGAMLITDSWLKHYFNDKFNLKVGVMRNNIEQSYLSAVGEYVNGVFTGRAADNKFYLEAQGKLPHQIYSYARAAYGVITAQNLITNQYFEGYVGIGKLLYNNPKNKWINTFATDVVSYNSAYQYNLLNIYDSAGNLFGGYFSPSYFNATTGNVRLEGHFNKLPLRYGVKAFGGIQNALTPDQTTPTWGYSPYVSYAINDRISIYAAYNHFNFADVQRDQFVFSAVIRGFRKNAKN